MPGTPEVPDGSVPSRHTSRISLRDDDGSERELADAGNSAYICWVRGPDSHAVAAGRHILGGTPGLRRGRPCAGVDAVRGFRCAEQVSVPPRWTCGKSCAVGCAARFIRETKLQDFAQPPAICRSLSVHSAEELGAAVCSWDGRDLDRGRARPHRGTQQHLSQCFLRRAAKQQHESTPSERCGANAPHAVPGDAEMDLGRCNATLASASSRVHGWAKGRASCAKRAAT